MLYERIFMEESPTRKNVNTRPVPAVTYRPFEPADLTALARILGDVWWKGLARSDRELEAMGTADFASYFSRATFSEVAVIDGIASGVVLARAGQPDDEHARAWKGAADRAMATVRSLNPEGQREMERYLARERAIDLELIAQSGCDERFELVLFAVAANTRGLGVGKRLLADAERSLRASGATTYFLYTDTGCTWQFYEHRGMRQAARFKVPEEERGSLCEQYFVYEGYL